MARKFSHGVYQFRLLQLMIFAEMKQETMHVEWYPSDNSDPEAVSGSSTNLFDIKKTHFGFFFVVFDEFLDP